MTEPMRAGLQGAALLFFIAGLLLFLNETRSTGEAPETFQLILSSNPASIVGAVLAVIAAAALVLLYLSGRKGTLKHRKTNG